MLINPEHFLYKQIFCTDEVVGQCYQMPSISLVPNSGRLIWLCILGKPQSCLRYCMERQQVDNWLSCASDENCCLKVDDIEVIGSSLFCQNCSLCVKYLFSRKFSLVNVNDKIDSFKVLPRSPALLIEEEMIDSQKSSSSDNIFTNSQKK